MAAEPHATSLFEPIRIGPLEVAGRLFKTATAETRASEDPSRAHNERVIAAASGARRP